MPTPLILPQLTFIASRGEIMSIHAQPGQALKRGAALVDIEVNVGGGETHDCPPVSHYRLHTREAATVLSWQVAVGDKIEPHAILAEMALASQTQTADSSGPHALRLSVVGIVPDHGF
jgi:hypothetical protein